MLLMEMNQQMDPMVAASNVYQYLGENNRMRVLRVIFKPRDTAKMHHHPEHMAFVLKGGKIAITSEGKTQEMNMEEGKAVFLPEQNHEATNIGNSVIDLLVVELK